MNNSHRPHFATVAMIAGLLSVVAGVIGLVQGDEMASVAAILFGLATLLALRVRHNLKTLPTPDQERAAALRAYSEIDRSDEN